MTILFVAPSMFSTGEAMTALVCAERLRGVGHSVYFLCSPFIGERLPMSMPYRALTTDRATNIAMWYGLLAELQPNVIIFADLKENLYTYEPYAFGDAAWLAALDHVDAELMTFDHIGLMQRPGTVRLGRAPRQHIEVLPALPRHMTRLLPCPIHEPDDVRGRDGIPFQYWTPYSVPTDDIVETRTALAGSGLLVAHFVPAWTERLAQLLEYPYYEGLSAFFQRAFTGLGQPVTVVSINTSGLLTPSLTKDVSVVNLMAPSYNFIERLLHGADLVLSENAISSIIGKAVCAEIPAAILRADDFDVFPAWDRDGVDRLGVFNDSSYAGTFDMLDMDDDSIEGAIMRLHALLTDETARESAIALGSVYASKVAELPWIEDIL